MTVRRLSDYLDETSGRFPHLTAVVDEAGHSLTYDALRDRVHGLARYLAAHGVGPGDRVGLAMPKSLEAVVAIFGVLRAGAAYVPVDVNGPSARGRAILEDCRIRAAVVHHDARAFVPNEARPDIAVVAGGAAEDDWPAAARSVVTLDEAIERAGPPVARQPDPDDLAYVIYTSGSTGRPKGAMITHANVVAFVEWFATAFGPGPEDRFSGFSPFFFDPSIVDLFPAMRSGASVHLISETLGRAPRQLARFLSERRISMWCSTPSALAMLAQFGGLGELDFSHMRLVLFGGEVFPIRHLRELQESWKAADYFNLYGPTETTVACTFAPVPRHIPADREAPFPIGQPCDHCDAMALDDSGREVPPGAEGILHISGASVFAGYWDRPEETARALKEIDGRIWYDTGDVVRWNPGEGYTYVGRVDRMVKRRGFRIELGEIERAIYAHPAAREVAVVSIPDACAGVQIVAFIACDAARAPSLVELKTFVSSAIPAYMSPDRFVFQQRLPKTPTDKVDYQALRGLLIDVPAC